MTTESNAGPSAIPVLMARLVVAWIVYLCVARAFSPGFLELSAPLHSDVYRYYEIASKPFEWQLLLSPRPLMLLALRLLDVDSFGVFYVLLLAAPVALPVFMLAALERVAQLRVGWLATVCYVALCYVLPSFYELAPLDFGGACAGIFACLAAIALVTATRWRRVAAYALLTWLSLECKPAYAFVLCVLPLLTSAGTRPGERWRAAMVAFVVCLMVFAKDHWIGSSFVGVGAESGSSYQLLGGPVIMLEAAKFYIQRLFSPVTWVVLAALAAWVLRQRSWRPLAALALLGAAAILPMLLIPNHRFVMYTWFASSILLLVLPIASTRILAMPRNVALWSLALIAVTVLALWSESRFLSIHRGWYEYNQRMNANIMRSLHVLSTQLTPGEKVLVSGQFGPYVPYKNDALVAAILPSGVEWTVVAPPSEDPLIAMSPNTRRYTRITEIDGASFDRHVAYDAEGNIRKISSPDPRLGHGGDTPERRALLFCASSGNPDAQERAACLATVH